MYPSDCKNIKYHETDTRKPRTNKVCAVVTGLKLRAPRRGKYNDSHV